MPVLYFLAVILLIGIDQFVKYWVVAHLALGQSLSVVGGLLSITRINNTGAAWSIFSGHQFIFVVIALVATVLIIY
ncbi:MAG: signal peptidase II, partial [Lentilactobacillus diolivorans]